MLPEKKALFERANPKSMGDTRFMLTAAIERGLDGNEEQFAAYFFAIYHCSPDDPGGINERREQPLSVAAQNLVSAEGIWQSRKTKIQTDDQTHLDELSKRIDWIEQQPFARGLVHIVDREADSVDHLRQWSKQGHHWLVRLKAGSKL